MNAAQRSTIIGLIHRTCGEELAKELAGHLKTDGSHIGKLRDALEAASNGLKWYRDAFPDADSGADDEMMAQIEEALAAPAPVEAIGGPVAVISERALKKLADGTARCVHAYAKVVDEDDVKLYRGTPATPSSQDVPRAVPAPMTGDQLDRMVLRFLIWRLPTDFSPDCGISFDGRKDDQWNKNKSWPVGTNLLNGEQARQMLLHVLATPRATSPGTEEE